MLAAYAWHAYNHYERNASMCIPRPDPALSTAVTREGKGHDFLTALPVSPHTFIRAKFIVGFGMGMLGVIAAAVALIIFFPGLELPIVLACVLCILFSFLNAAMALSRDIKKPRLAVLGLAFKGGTDDCRESPAMQILAPLVEKGYYITAFDPKAMENAKKILGNKILYAKDEYEAAKGADVLVILTEWNRFKKLDLEKLGRAMQKKRIVDLRNTFRPEDLEKAGFEYSGIGVTRVSK